jgi:prevent-host-death family protein
MRVVSTHDAKTHLSSLLRDVERGEEVQILRGGTPVARIVRVDATAVVSRRPKVGTVTSAKVKCAPEAFSPLGPDELEKWGFA